MNRKLLHSPLVFGTIERLLLGYFIDLEYTKFCIFKIISYICMDMKF